THHSPFTLSSTKPRLPTKVLLPISLLIAEQTFHRSDTPPASNPGAGAGTRRRRETIGPDRERSIDPGAGTSPRAFASVGVRVGPAAGGPGAWDYHLPARPILGVHGWVWLCVRCARPKFQPPGLPNAGSLDCKPPRRNPTRKKAAANPRP